MIGEAREGRGGGGGGGGGDIGGLVWSGGQGECGWVFRRSVLDRGLFKKQGCTLDFQPCIAE